MLFSQALLGLIQSFEGFSASPYRCPAGVWTVGYGHVLRQGDGMTSPVTREQAELWLVQDCHQAAQSVDRYITQPLQRWQREALISFTFNLGSGALQRSTLRRVINRGVEDEEAITREWSRWVWAGGRRLPGLVRRRHAELQFFLQGIWS